jgi:hypothetical protein
VARHRRPRAHGDMLTVAVRGPIAEKMRAMAERHGMSLAKLLADMALVYEGEVAGGYEVGTCLAALQVQSGNDNMIPRAR